MNRFTLLLSSAALVGLVTAAEAATIFSPDQGVLCDKKGGFCVDSQGLSATLTTQWLGAKAGKKLTKMMSENPDMDTTSFTMSNGMHCETRERMCTVNKGSDEPDPVGNKTLFEN